MNIKFKRNILEESLFWKITTKWYFFPALYLILIIIAMLFWYPNYGIYKVSDIFGMFIYGTYIFPTFLSFIFPDLGIAFSSILFHALFALIIIMLMRYKSLHYDKTGLRNLKAAIITLIFLMLISFSIGFVIASVFMGP
mgnify:CR=1 FL=1